MGHITELGYARFGVSDLEAWHTFASDYLGLEVTSEGEADRLYLRADAWHHRIILEAGDADDVTGIGLRVAGPEEFTALQATLNEHTIVFEVVDEPTCRAHRVLEMLTLKDPSGHPLEIFHGPQVDTHKPFYPGRGMFGRFVTGSGGLGHMMLSHNGLDETYAFYRLLGMRGSVEYRIPVGDDGVFDILFMHCNDRDHTFAFGAGGKKRINHLMLEVDNLDDVYYTYEKVREQFPIATLPGKHANDQMFSFYCVSPSGFQVEIGWGGRPATHQSEYYTGDTYGHQPNRQKAR